MTLFLLTVRIFMALEGILPVMVLIVLAEVIAEDTAVTVTDIFAFVSAGLSPTIGATPNE